MKPQRINLNSDALEEFVKNFNAALEIVMKQLMARRMRKGTVSGKVNIEIRENVDSKTGEIYYSVKLKPDVKMKIAADEKLECQEQNGIIMQQDKDGRPVIASEQIGMDELMPEKEGA